MSSLIDLKRMIYLNHLKKNSGSSNGDLSRVSAPSIKTQMLLKEKESELTQLKKESNFSFNESKFKNLGVEFKDNQCKSVSK